MHRALISVVLAGLIAVPLSVFSMTIAPDDYGTGYENTGVYCPSLSSTFQRGARGAQVSELQVFLTDFFDLDENVLTGGYFGRLTQQYVVRFQQANGLPAYGIVGSLTRAAIARSCGGSTPTPNPPCAAPGCVPIPIPPICPVYSLAPCPPGQHYEYGPPYLDANRCERPNQWCVPDVPTPPCSGSASGCVPPRPARFSASPMSGSAPLTVTFSSYEVGWGTRSFIDFGDGTQEGTTSCSAPTDYCIQPGQNTHTYTQQGTYVVRLMRSDGPMLPAFSQVASMTITVYGGESGPLSVSAWLEDPSGRGKETFAFGEQIVIKWSASPPSDVNLDGWLGNPSTMGIELRPYGNETAAGTRIVRVSPTTVFPYTYTWNVTREGLFGDVVTPGRYYVYVNVPSKQQGGYRTGVAGPIWIGTPPSPGGITITAPNGGEQWEAGTMNTITWTPYSYYPTEVNPSNQVSAYLVPEGKGSSGKIVPSGKASIHWEGQILDDVTGLENPPLPGAYRIRVVNNVTGATDTSDAPFTIIPKSVDLKLAESDGPISVWAGGSVAARWTSNSTGCELHNAVLQSSPGTYPAQIPPSGSAAIIPSVGTGGVTIMCTKHDGSRVFDTVFINPIASISSLQIVTPNGGEVFDPRKTLSILFRYSGLSSYSAALYKNDQWKTWIVKDNPLSGSGQQSLDWQGPGDFVTGLGTGDNAGAIFKIYVTGQRSDRQGYVDDKSDATFSFAPTVSSSPAAVASWTPTNFSVGGTRSASCTGPTLTGFSERYGVWVGAQLCGSSNTYKLYMSTAQNGTYYQIVDYGGHGQDHCELINPSFTIPNDDDITSGTCKNCAVGGLVDVQNETVFVRSRIGEPFTQATAAFWGDLTTDTYTCGVPVVSNVSAASVQRAANTASTLSALQEILGALKARLAR
jgi:PKD repeat protein